MFLLQNSLPLQLSRLGLLILISFQASGSALQIRATVSPRVNNEHCSEVLTHNLVCPSVGTFAVAGECDYFVRCMETNRGIESTAEWCPYGQIYMVNRCTKSALKTCPQKFCPSVNTATEKVLTGIPVKPKPGKGSTLLPNLHPSLNTAVQCTANAQYHFTFLLSTILIIMNRLI